jgi:hypothetical protein
MKHERIIVFACVIFFLLVLAHRCDYLTNPSTIYTSRQGDSVPYVVYSDKPVPYAVHIHDTIPIYDTVWTPGDTTYILNPVDTARILRDYFARVQYLDTVKNDSSALIVLNETIFKNRIENREVIFQNRRKTAIIHENNHAIVLGVGGSLTGIDISAGYRNKRNVFNLTYSRLGVGLRYQREIVIGK